MASYLRSIELEAEMVKEDGGEDTIRVTVPTFRPDLEREIDLVEEVARLYGYGLATISDPVAVPSVGHLFHAAQRPRRMARSMSWMPGTIVFSTSTRPGCSLANGEPNAVIQGSFFNRLVSRWRQTRLST